MNGLIRTTAWRSTSATILLVFVIALSSAFALAQTVTLGEAVDNTALTWTTGGEADWIGQTVVSFHGGDAAESGQVGFLEHSWLQTEIAGPGILSFYWSVLSASERGKLSFYVDEEKQSSVSTYGVWEREVWAIPSGSHTLKWDYSPTLPFGALPGYVDRVEFSTEPSIILLSPDGGETWDQRDAYNIVWAGHEEAGPTVKVDLYQGSDLAMTLSTSTDIDESYRWFVPPTLAPGTDYRIRVTSNSQPSIYDYSDGTFEIAPQQSSLGGVLMLGGVDDYAVADDESELDVGDEAGESLTAEAWVNFEVFSPLPMRLIHKGAYGLSTDYWSQWVDPPGILYRYRCLVFWLALSTGSSLEYRACQTQFGGGFHIPGWHHVAGIFDNDVGEVRLYMDGELLGAADLGQATVINSADPLHVGGSMRGMVDEVRISDVARYTAESYTLPTLPFTCDTNARALWHFDECEGATRFHDACEVVDNLLVGHGDAHTEGMTCQRAYLPLIVR